jgi:hypothetical protein
MQLAKAYDLQVGDIVGLSEDAFSTAIVKQVRDGVVTLWRPYGTTADFLYSGGAICYVGIEEFRVCADDREFVLFRHTNLR